MKSIEHLVFTALLLLTAIVLVAAAISLVAPEADAPASPAYSEMQP